MENNQIKLLSTLARKIKSEKKDSAKIFTTLKSARIITKKGNFTKHYSNLKKVVSVAE